MEPPSQTESFADKAVDEDGWFFTAEDLLAAAKALEPAMEGYWRLQRERAQLEDSEFRVFDYEPDVRGPYLMLTAYAIENFCKAVVMCDSWWLIFEKKELPRKFTKHDLLELLKRVGIPLSSEDEELAFRLERSAVWAGRYPVPTHPAHRTLYFTRARGEKVVPSWHREDDVKLAKDLVERVRDFVVKELEARHQAEINRALHPRSED
ncbi:MAG TPA: hypothetical protein VEL74_13940 [Thermoanaerobaculia bacterium]|nr:hypothetical protein [Thermoanaerobaculia bacterium]